MLYDEVVENFKKAYNMTTRPMERFYPESHIFDENESVAWNRNEVIKRNAEIKETRRQLELNRYQAIKDATYEIVLYLCENYSDISTTKVRKIFHYNYNMFFDTYFDYDIERVIQACEDILEIMIGED